jgi:tRNA (mo5U34)-methyltransferase
VLDAGCWDGFYSFAAERRGAARVVATDSFVWQRGSRAGFELAHKALDSKVEPREIDVLDLRPEEVGTFDIVLFLGVLYHMRHPMLALDRMAAITRDLLVVESVVDLLYLPTTRALKFYPSSELGRDDTNWFAPTPLGLEAMLHAAGFARVKLVWPSIGRLRWWRLQSLLGSKAVKRVVFHAWKE